MPVFYRRVFGLEPWEISIYLCIVLTVGGLRGSYAGGFTADFWSRVSIHIILYYISPFLIDYYYYYLKKHKAGKIWLVATSTVISIPFIVCMLTINNVWVSLVCLLVASFFGEMWFGSSAAAIQDIIDPSLRAFATSIYLMGIGIGGISSLLVS